MNRHQENDLISVIIPVFNREGLIGETLENVLRQTHRSWECIVVDDGSNDKTLEIVKEFARRDERVKLFRRPQTRKKGASSCRNFGLEKASGDYIQFLDSDDLLKENKFTEQLKLLKAAPLSIVTCKWGSFSQSSKLNVKTRWHSYGNFKNSLKLLHTFGKYDEYFPPIVYLVPKQVIEKAGSWDESLSHNDDAEYFSRVVLNVKDILFCDTTEAYYRSGAKNRLSLLDDEQKIRSAIKSWKIIQHNLKGYERICRKYSGNGIRNIYKKIKDSHPHLVEENADFFRENIRPIKWYHRLIN